MIMYVMEWHATVLAARGKKRGCESCMGTSDKFQSCEDSNRTSIRPQGNTPWFNCFKMRLTFLFVKPEDTSID
jgi:hypothetical protein